MEHAMTNSPIKLEPNHRSVLTAVAENTCFVSISGALMFLRDKGLIESVAPSEEHTCGWRLTQLGRIVLGCVPSDRSDASAAESWVAGFLDEQPEACGPGMGLVQGWLENAFRAGASYAREARHPATGLPMVDEPARAAATLAQDAPPPAAAPDAPDALPARLRAYAAEVREEDEMEITEDNVREALGRIKDGGYDDAYGPDRAVERHAFDAAEGGLPIAQQLAEAGVALKAEVEDLRLVVLYLARREMKR